MVDAGRYVSRLINRPWTRINNCWRLVREVQRDLFGVTLPPIINIAPEGGRAARETRRELFTTHEERRQWQESDVPTHGAVALMRLPAASVGDFQHAGVYLDLDGGGVLHTNKPHGVVFDSLSDLMAIRRWVPTYFIRR